jgi:transcriptional regulator with XRE-family HTH domain
MSRSISTTAKIWKKMATKDYRDAYVAAHVSNTVASQISMLREKEGWTQKQLAQKAGMSQSRISALEDPNYENIEVGTLRRLASAFDVALTVRFISFSELASWTAGLSTDKLSVPSFLEDHLPVQAAEVSRPHWWTSVSPLQVGVSMAEASRNIIPPHFPVIENLSMQQDDKNG